jgi:type I restriction enzyme S subunit
MEHLGEICDICIGKTPRRDNPAYWGGNNTWATISDLNDSELVSTKECITDLAVREVRPKLVRAGTLLFSFKLTIGKMAFAGKDLFTNEAIAALPVRDHEHVAPKYLYYALKVASVRHGAEEAAKGWTLNKKSLPLLQILLPATLAQQRRIVARIEELTSRVEQARSVLQEADGELASFTPALLARAFRGEL